MHGYEFDVVMRQEDNYSILNPKREPYQTSILLLTTINLNERRGQSHDVNNLGNRDLPAPRLVLRTSSIKAWACLSIMST